VESFHLEKFDLVISSSHAVARLCDAEIRNTSATAIRRCGGTPKRLCLQPYQAAGHVAGAKSPAMDHGRTVDTYCEFGIRSDRIRKYYGRNADIVYPPIDTSFFKPSGKMRDNFYLAAGAIVPYKRLDVAIEAFNSLGYPLVIAGTGPELKRLRKLAGSNIKFLGWVTDEELRRLYQSARALVFLPVKILE
jgi:glycosyltransferase involved in cell wall biosynthesis